jgi:hypothetical protein
MIKRPRADGVDFDVPNTGAIERGVEFTTGVRAMAGIQQYELGVPGVDATQPVQQRVNSPAAAEWAVAARRGTMPSAPIERSRTWIASKQ